MFKKKIDSELNFFLQSFWEYFFKVNSSMAIFVNKTEKIILPKRKEINYEKGSIIIIVVVDSCLLL